MSKKIENVVILGASHNVARYSNKAQKMLKDHGHKVFPVNPVLKEIEGDKCYPSLKVLKESLPDINFDTLTVYVNPEISTSVKDEIVNLKVKRVILNPGTEDDKLFNYLTKAGIEVEMACTLVLLQTSQF